MVTPDLLVALRRPLEAVSRDGFALLDSVQNLPETLARAAEQLSTAYGAPLEASFRQWQGDLGRWAQLPRSERERLVALGLRLCAMASLAAPAPPTARPVALAPAARTPKPAPTATPTSNAPQAATSIAALRGIGPVLAERLRARGLVEVADLLYLLPRRWDDLRELVTVGALQLGKPQLTAGVVQSARFASSFRRRILEVRFVGDDGKELIGRWFNYRGSPQQRFPTGARFLLAGTPRVYKGGLEMIHPETIADDGTQTGGTIRVRYPEIEGVPGRTVERLCQQAASTVADAVPDGIPAAVRTAHRLLGQGEALGLLHRPPESITVDELARLNEGTAPAQQRLIFDEFFFLQLGLARRRGEQRREAALPLAAGHGAEAHLAPFFALLPFAPTGAQRRAIACIASDIAEPHPMHRLLQGDVGSGKTVVAFAACELAMASGAQAALMAPTEILAEQHFRTLSDWAQRLGRRLALLTASTPRQARESTLALLAAGQIDLLVGTHALLSERVAFSQLGLIVIDEQHRFGVAQRALLRDKGTFGEGRARRLPHLLVMTATPIPRSLALTVYGDLDLQTLDEMPPGRKPATTRVHLGKTARKKALAAVQRALDEKRQVYWVCPLIEESEKVDYADATAAAAFLREALGEEVGLLHGRLPTVDKDRIMRAFRAHELRVLVATTVIEVGVDVPNASVMVIEGAERFGLAQLHQLRGRIGRGGGASLCLLLSEVREATERLAVMEEHSSGFDIAEADLRIRGPGEIFGTRQAGLPRLRYADLVRDAKLLAEARHAAWELLERDPQLVAAEHATTRAVLEARWADASLFGEEAG